MKFRTHLVAGAVLAGLAGTAAISQSDDKAALAAVEARKSVMHLYAFNLGMLGAMAKGEVEYDADKASGAAGNLAKLTSMDQSAIWLPGTDSDTLGDATRALPAIWEEGSDVAEHAAALREAAAALEAAAGGGLDSLRGAMGPVGQSCGSCHEDYRKPNS